MPVGKTSETAFDPNGLLLPESSHAFGEMVTIISGQNLVAGALLGQITASGKYNLALAAAGDGSNTPAAVLAEACDASGGDKSAFVFYTGSFREAKMTFGAGITAAAQRRALAQKGLRIVPQQPA